MKRALLFMILMVFCFNAYAQDEDTTGPTAQGSWLIEANTGFGSDGFLTRSGSTSFGLITSDGVTIWSVGAEAGYFVMDDFAIKIGLGYSDFDGESIFSYKIGGKYYVIGTIPFEVSLTGASIDDVDENPLWLGLQGGYAIFLNDHISIEPGLRYNLSLNEDFTDEGLFEFRVGFALFF
jgi:hypothetical protein